MIYEDFDVRWNRALLSASEAHTEKVLEGLYTQKREGVGLGETSSNVLANPRLFSY